ncbi:MAG: outer membrane protein assembly factor BamD [Acidobacteria bacterium]|nr:outer membrane protein assembly factor BamD [Acidobacteriota bacterium]
MKKNRRLLALAGVVSLALTVAGCHRHKHAPPDLSASQEPDKVLFERATEDIKNKRFDTARLTLQTLINTYPDSDYLAAAKLAIADSYYEESTSASLNHAEVEYKDFITFFPNAPEVAFAQYRAAMCHYRQLEKADRDRTHARRAEEEFQRLLVNYPESEYAAEGEQRLIAVQEILAEGEFHVGRFYFIRGSWRAAAARLAPLVERYPNFSKRDESLWMLGQAWEKHIRFFWEPDPERAASYYARLIREHPMSENVADAKDALARLGQPVPEPDPVLLARAQSVAPVNLQDEERRGLLGRLFGLFSSHPDVSAAAARLGPPPLEPPEETPRIPPPPFQKVMTAVHSGRVEIKQVEKMPEGAAASPQGQPADQSQQPAQAQGEDKDQKQTDKKEPARKKSFWRKLVPFW